MIQRKYDAIDLTKFCMSILIVALHADALLDISPWLNTFVCGGLARLGVPFFFVTSAYFLYSKPVSWESTRRYCKRLLTLYAAWFVVSIPKTIFDRFICSSYPFGETLFRFVRSFFVTSTFSGSWFIVSCIFCAVLFYYLDKLSQNRYRIVVIILSVLTYFWCVFSSAYGKLIDVIGLSLFYDGYVRFFANPYTSFLVGIPYFALGKYFATRSEKQMDGGVVCTFGGFISIATLFVEVYLTSKYSMARTTDCYLMLLPCTFFLFPKILDWKIEIKNANWLRIASTIIFFSQFLLLFSCEIFEWVFKITIPCLVKFFIAAIGGIILTQLILVYVEKPRWRWLKYFY